MTTETRTARRRADTRERLLAAAEQLFIEGDLGAIKIEKVATIADVSVGTVYTHFGSKNGLILAAADRTLSEIEQKLATAYRAEGSPLEQISNVGETYMNLLISRPLATRFLFSGEICTLEPEVRSFITARIQALQQQFVALIDTAIAAGEARPVDSEHLAMFLFASWPGVIEMAHQTGGFPGRSDPESCLRLARELIVDALRVT